ncbi:MAG: ATP-binding protein [Candidatus Gastranaerophilales bacterium]|nr:ATP-binding protein [Candidatus Gastranaerophilales bacterium]
MQKYKFQKALGLISKILNKYENADDTLDLIFKYIHEIFSNEKSYIFFISPSGLYLKAESGCSETESFNLQKVKEMGLLTRRFIKNQETVVDNAKEIAEEIGIETSSGSSFVASPLKIKDALFGVLLLQKDSVEPFSVEDKEIVEAFSSVAAYIIKDAELSDVFKLQLKILQENIIEKTEAYVVITEKNKQILEANKVKDEFLANVSHELRTPLHAIINSSDALKMEVFGPLNEKQLEYVNDINASAIHLSGIINEILDMSKLEANQMSLNKSSFDVESAVDEVLNITRSLADKKNITFKKDYYHSKILINADFKKLQQILYNLLSNAIKYTNPDGVIEIGFTKDKDNVRFFVKDNGIGIEEKYHGKIFAKFQQIENVYTKKESSTGLGLTITKEFVEMHGGKIWLESKVNEGTTFIFELPA